MKNYAKFLLLIVTATLMACTQLPEAEYKASELIPEDSHPAPMMFSGLKLDLPAGADVGSVSDFGNEAVWLMIPANRNMLRGTLRHEDLTDIFSGALEGQGYDVVNYLEPVFDEEIENEILRSEYRVAGKIIEAKMDANYDTQDALLGKFIIGPQGYSGDLWMKIRWSVYDALNRAVVYQTETEGRGRHPYPDPEGLQLMVNAAFEMAAHNLGADAEFRALLVTGKKPVGWPKPKKHEDRPLKYEPDEEVTIEPKPLSMKPFSAIAEDVRKAAVMVQGGKGHGSGFFITDAGHIITNQHVVGNAQRVRIVTAGQEEKRVAQVLRTHRGRDVALLKLEEKPDFEITTLPLRLEWPGVSEDIYAIGAPQSTRLQDTISKGIVSAHRPAYKIIGTRMDFIQGDVPIHGGNSGGPLVDAHGNLVGISVIGLYMHEGKRSSDLNLFIPIGDALEKLDIEYAANETAGPAPGPTSSAANAPTDITN